MSKSRKAIRSLGATSIGQYTPWIDMHEFTKGYVHIRGTGTRMDMLCSPNGGTTSFVLMRPGGVRGRWTLTGTWQSNMIPVMPSMFRGYVDTAAMDAGYLEGIREVA